MKYLITEQQYDKVIDRFISYQLEPHEEKKTSDYPESIFWVKNGEIIAEIDRYDFWLKNDIWKTISTFFSLGSIETQGVVSDWLEEHYKLGKLTPYKTNRNGVLIWKEIEI